MLSAKPVAQLADTCPSFLRFRDLSSRRDVRVMPSCREFLFETRHDSGRAARSKISAEEIPSAFRNRMLRRNRGKEDRTQSRTGRSAVLGRSPQALRGSNSSVHQSHAFVGVADSNIFNCHNYCIACQALKKKSIFCCISNFGCHASLVCLVTVGSIRNSFLFSYSFAPLRNHKVDSISAWSDHRLIT